MLIGYARVSTQDQNLELQREALSKAGCQKVFEDKMSGMRADRPGLTKMLEILREGDTLVVWKLDWLGRSVKQRVNLVGELRKLGVQFKSVTDFIDTGTPSGQFFFHVMASLAEMDRELTVERTRAGLEVAKQLGRKGGRKPKMTDSKIELAKKLLANGVSHKDVAKNLGVSIPTCIAGCQLLRMLSVLFLFSETNPCKDTSGSRSAASVSACMFCLRNRWPKSAQSRSAQSRSSRSMKWFRRRYLRKIRPLA